jgi:hypothetical protein
MYNSLLLDFRYYHELGKDEFSKEKELFLTYAQEEKDVMKQIIHPIYHLCLRI